MFISEKVKELAEQYRRVVGNFPFGFVAVPTWFRILREEVNRQDTMFKKVLNVSTQYGVGFMGSEMTVLLGPAAAQQYFGIDPEIIKTYYDNLGSLIISGNSISLLYEALRRSKTTSRPLESIS